MSNSKFDRKIKRISHKDWDDIKGRWLGYLPLIEEPGNPPVSGISDHPGLYEVGEQLGETGEFRDSLPGMREAVCHEGIFLLHKAVHVACASFQTINAGMLTWSLSTAYHSALFSQKATLNFLGVTFPQVNNKTIMVDVWPDVGKSNRGKVKREIESEDELQFIRMPGLQHWHLWKIFQRVIRVSSITFWDEWSDSFIQKIDHKKFARQRNRIHYWNHIWIFNDLFEAIIDPEFGAFSEDYLGEFTEIEDVSDFSVQLCFLLLRNALLMFQELVDEAPILREENKLILENLRNRCPIFIDTWFRKAA